MPGDYSRKIFRPTKHYSGVLMQQGRVQLDADWNEQLDIANYRTQVEAIDVIGHSGVPKENDGFEIGVSQNLHNLTIAKGRIYVEGLLCELEDDASYTNQPYLPNPDFTAPASPPSSPPQSQLDLADGVYLVLLDAWQREITALDDRLIREVALGGPDTTTRLQNIWQVKLLAVGETSPPGSAITCDTDIPAFEDLIAPPTGKLNARTQPPKPEDNPCLLPPQTGYTRLENQLYRVEVQKGGPRDQVTFKWSRDNASVETTIKSISNKVLSVADTGKDQLLSFAGGQWVEIVDEESTLKGKAGPLFKIDKVDANTKRITLKTSAAALASLQNLKLRRWDQNDKNNANADGVAATADWIELENGIQVRFSDGDYHAGDYWLIPARTATGEIEWPPYEIPNSNPIPQPPRGIRHYFCRLALVRSQGGELSVIEDCRKPFPPLTGICAEDICFDNRQCDFEGAETVQEALDRLCAARDLRFHNKHLHGWGIVCGLQVECGSNTNVRVRPGYAITCEGDDVLLNEIADVNLLDLVGQPEASPPTELTDGEVCLVLEPNESNGRRFRLEPFKPPKSNLDALLEGTIWRDVIDDCLKPLIDFGKGEFTAKPEEGTLLVGPTQKRISTFTNLLIQLVNQQNGSFVYLSGDEPTPQSEKALRTEDAILRAFYRKLRELLQSHTFCAMFENARPFPDYPDEYIPLGIRTIFGKGFQKRFRVSPDSRTGYSLGAGNKIHVFDLAKSEMVAELEFPGGPTAIVQDVAISKDNKQLYAVATIKDKDSVFAVAEIGSGFKFKWREPTTICDILFHSLGTLTDSKSVFATGKGKGLYEINPDSVNATPDPRNAFNAVGHLEIFSEGGVAFATASNASGISTVYNRVLRINLRAPDPNPTPYIPILPGVQLTGEDDITISTKDDTRLYIVVNAPPGQSTKHVVIFDIKQNTAPLAVVKLDENTGIRLAFNQTTRHAMVAFDDSYRVGLITPGNVFVDKYRHPVQISPGSIVAAPDGKRVYVLNYTSNTISSIPAELLHPERQIPLQPLVDYRVAVLNAFADLLGGLLQYLKDCFCDHFLINCPTCDPVDKLYLACITIKNGKVFKVCNFSLRKYVHSFPTVEYWMSVIPIIPMLKMAIEKFCCSVLPAFFGKFTAFKPDTPEIPPSTSTKLKSTQIRSGVTFAQQADFHNAVSKVLTTSAPTRKLFADTVTGSFVRKFTPTPDTAIHRTDIENKLTDDAKKKLEEKRIIVDKVEAYDPNKAGHNLVLLAKTPENLEPGTRVNLVTKDDKVMFYTLAEEKTETVEELRTEFETTRVVATQTKAALEKMSPEVAALKARMDADESTIATHKTVIEKALPQLEVFNKNLEASRAEVAANKATLEKLTPQFEDLRTKFAADSAVLAANKATLEKALPRLEKLAESVDKSSPQLVELQKKLDAANTALAENKTAVTEALTLRQEISTLRQELLQVRQTHQQELAARDKDISELRTTLTSSRTLLDNLNERVKRFPNP